jgi:dTMP kinase
MVGKLLVLEGTDGSGKATQVKLLRERLEKRGAKVYNLSYPDYESIYGRIINDFLHFKISLGVEEQFFVYLLDMIKDKDKVKKALEESDFVIMDRYLFSTLSYQCSNGFDYDRAKDLIKLMGLNKPFAVFYIDVPVEVSMQRKKIQKQSVGEVDKFERDKALLTSVKQIYEKLITEKFFSDNWLRVEGAGTPESVANSMADQLSKITGNGI